MTTLSIRAFAKINLFLSVLEKRPDGYHELDSIFQSISLFDTLTITQSDHLSLHCSDPALPTDGRNLAYRAAQAFFSATSLPGGVSITLQKKIPMQAGLGGGSADAAAVLLGCNALYGAPLSKEALLEIGAKLGADVPFCILGGTHHASGFGQALTPCAPLPPCTILCVMGKEGISTKEAFAQLDQKDRLHEPTSAVLLQALTAQDYFAVCRALYNSFTAVTPDAPKTVQRLLSLGADGACLSGSGSAVFSLFSDLQNAHQAKTAFEKEGFSCYLCEPLCDTEKQLIF